MEDSIGALVELQEEGKIRHIGVSNFGLEDLERAQQIATIVSVQNRYNVIDRQSEDVLEECDRQQLAFFPWAPIASGRDVAAHGPAVDEIAAPTTRSPRQVALAWLLAHSPVIIPIPGTSSIAHFDENLDAVELELEPEELETLDELAPA